MKTNKIFIPPIKSQGIKSKLVEWIASNIEGIEFDRWVEPFMGTGVVPFNIRPQKALLCDTNPHLIKFYNALKNKEITSAIVRNFLTVEGEKLLKSEGSYYYEVRQRFNEEGNPLDFLFLSRSCFNGMMRFNQKGGFNVPFCRKPNRFAPALITKITNQVENISQIIDFGDYEFKTQDFKETLKEVNPNDLIYADPPYIDRHTDYFNSWSEEYEIELKKSLFNSKAKFVLSTWLSNKYRTNDYIFSVWEDCYVATKGHFYHIGGKEENRNAIYEALLSNVRIKNSIANNELTERIENNKSRLTTEKKEKIIPIQPTLFEEMTVANKKYSAFGR